MVVIERHEHMHRYLRAIGFSEVKTRQQLQEIINEVVTKTIVRPIDQSKDKTEQTLFFYRDFVADSEDHIFAEMCLNFSENTGICVRGEFDENNVFYYEYFFPYLKGTQISSCADIIVERHMEKESYAGICDDIKVGVSLIFYLQNVIAYKKRNEMNMLPVSGTSLTLSALSIDGTIMMPIIKNEKQKKKIKKASSQRNNLIAQARMGNEDAIESLTLDDMDVYSSISRKIHNEDVFSLVDTCFMPYGVECDLYSILGEILDIRYDTNTMTGEELVVMTIECNELTLEVCINKKDLYGEPAVGRRFKGVIWLQGYINYPTD